MEHSRPYSDGLSRLLGTLGILLAIGGSAYLFQENQKLSRRVVTLEGTVAQPGSATVTTQALSQRIDDLAASDKAFQAKWDTQLSAEVADFKTRADNLLDQQSQTLEQQRQAFATQLADLKVDPAAIDAAVNQKLETLRKVVLAESKPALRVAQTVLKANEDRDALVTVIANDRDSEVGVDFVAFRPKPDGQFEVAVPTGDRKADVDWALRFLPEENTATVAGRHHDYERNYDLAKHWLPAQQSTSMTIEIENPKHLGWGLVGDLVIEYDDGKQLVVPNARAVFVADTVETDTLAGNDVP